MGERHEEKEFLLLADLNLTGCHSDRCGIVEYPAALLRLDEISPHRGDIQIE